MLKIKTLFSQILIAALVFSCTGRSSSSVSDIEEGVSQSIALERKANISDVRYSLDFSIPQSRSESISSHELVTFSLKGKMRVLLDACGFAIDSVRINGNPTSVLHVNEHLVLAKEYMQKGENVIEIWFTAGEQPLNRRDELLYTLLVPDRARTLFPCFDQPDMKARYTLSLTVPQEWIAVSNTAEVPAEGTTSKEGFHMVRFGETEPLSTYLFSFVAGKFKCVSDDGITASGRPIHLFHRETDPAKVSECSEILRLVRESLSWLEDYTGIEYPFAKYDLIVLPDFQFGGMEHTGATLYNDRRIFLGPTATTDELLSRAALIAHETSHMWFGDLVTMRWFNDVWTKEVFANYFAAKIVRPLFPGIDHQVNDLKTYYSPAYAEDRTIGSNAIQRPLDNLNRAGLIYCNIIYDKSPVVMGMLEDRLGSDAFQNGIRKYLKTYSYDNASWDDLIRIFDEESSFDVSEWSRVWIKEKGMPVFDVSVEIGDGAQKTLAVRQSDPFQNGNIWQEKVSCLLAGDKMEEVLLDFCGESSVKVPLSGDHECIIPNADGKAYGWFRLGDEDALSIERLYPGVDDVRTRMSILMTLFENAWHGTIDRNLFLGWICDQLGVEQNPLLRSSLLSYGKTASMWIYSQDSESGVFSRFEDCLYSIASDESMDSEFRLLALRTLVSICQVHTNDIYAIWKSDAPFKGLTLGESDLTSMAYQLMLRLPDQSDDIQKTQSGRINNPDRKSTFLYVSRACSSDKAQRDAFFTELLSHETRDAESRVNSSLSLLCSPFRCYSGLQPEDNRAEAENEAVSRIRPALEAIEDIWRGGDIFFPQNWCSSLLGSQYSDDARQAVKDFADDTQIHSLLLTKVLQNAGWLLQ